MFSLLQSDLSEIHRGIIVLEKCLQKYVFFNLKQIVCAVRVPHILEPRFCPQYQLKISEYATCLVLEYESTKAVKDVYLPDMYEVEIVDGIRG
jgi:hypothetical protein